MTALEFWQNLPPEVRALAGELAAELLKGLSSTLGTALRPTPEEQALREAYTHAAAAFLACLDIPEDPAEQQLWEDHIGTLLEPLFADGRVQEALTDAVLHRGHPEAIDVAPFRAAWAEHHGSGAEVDLPWREGESLETAVRALARALEHEAESQSELRPFLIAARLRRVVDHLERGVRVEGMDDLLAAVRDLADRQGQLPALFTHLARMGYGVRVEGDVTDSIIITSDNNQVLVADRGQLTRLFLTLPERERMLTEYRAYLHRSHTQRLAFPIAYDRIPNVILTRIRLDQIYIELYAVRHKRYPGETSLLRGTTGTIVRYIQERRAGQRDIAEKGIPLEQVVDSYAQVIILGDPGAGKSTFLSHVVCTRVVTGEILPLSVPLGQADVAMEGGRSLLDAALDHLVAHKAGRARDLLREVLAEEIRAKRVLWLLDGLDEVRRHRREVVDGIARLVAEGHRVVVTSRPVGYEPIPGCDTLYEVLPLQEEDARTFVDRWFRALAAAQGVPEGEREAWVEERSRWMERQIEDRAGLREVARNPLMLTFLAVLAGDEPRKTFPCYRKDLYAQYVEWLFMRWETYRQGGKETSLLEGFNDPNEAREIVLWGFRQTALHLHKAYGGQPEQATRRATKAALSEELMRETGTNRFKASGWAEAVLDFWERAGLLDRYSARGREWLAFRHPTFREYGAACALAEAYAEDPGGLWIELEACLSDNTWEQVIPLTIAQLDRADSILERLLGKRDNTGYYPLFIAAAALAEGAPTGPAMHKRVVHELENVVRTGGGIPGARENSLGLLVALGESQRSDDVLQSLLALACDGGVESALRETAIRALERFGWSQELVTLACESEESQNKRIWASEALILLGREAEATQAWLRLAREGLMRAIDVLYQRLGRADLLLNLARDETAKLEIRRQVVQVLGDLDRHNDLLELIRDKSVDVRVQMEIVEVLSKVGQASRIVHTLLDLVRDKSVASDARAKAAELLGQLGQTSEASTAWLILARDKRIDARIRMKAPTILDQLGCTREAIQVWLVLAYDRSIDTGMRMKAAEALAQVGYADKAAEIWLALAHEKNIGSWVRMEAAEALARLGRTDKAAEVWLALADDESDESIDARKKMKAAKALTQLGHADKATEIWLALAREKNIGSWVRVEAIEALIRLGRTKEAVEAWRALAHSRCVDAQARAEAAMALGRLGKVDEATSILLSLTRDKDVDPQVRVEAASALGRLGQPNKAIQAWLVLARDRSIDASVRAEIALALVQRGRAEDVIPIFVSAHKRWGGLPSR